MRVTHRTLTETTLRNMNTNMERLSKLQDRLTSGQRISNPSDDPIGTSAAVEFRASLVELGQYIRNTDAASSWLDATDSTLGTLISTLQRARELAVSGGTGSLSTTDMQAVGNEVGQLLEQAVGLGNSTYAGQFLFGGFKVSSAPFTLNAGPPVTATYNGDSGVMQRNIDNSQSTLTVNVPGDTTFNPAFTALIDLRQDLDSGNSASVSSRISDLDSAIDGLLVVRTQVGARANRCSEQKDRLESLKTNIAGLLSKVQDLDMSEAITQFAQQQSIYQASLAAGGKAIQPSLLDYLR